MDTPQLRLAGAPHLCDKAAAEMLDFLYQLITAFENQYYAQLRRYHQRCEFDLAQPDLFDAHDEREPFNECDDELPPF